MKFSSHRVLLGGLLLLAVLAGLLLPERLKDEASRSAELPVSGLSWNPGASQAYDVLIESSFLMVLPGTGSNQSMKVWAEGVLQFRTLQVDSAQALVGMRFSAMDIRINGVSDAQLNSAFEHPFRVRYSLDGHPLEFEFPALQTAEHRQLIENLVRTFQFVVGQGDDWEVRETNASGEYQARYSRNTPAKITKKKLRYLDSNSGETAQVAQVQSTERIQLEPGVDWIVAMTVDESLVTNDPGTPEARVTNHAVLALRRGQSRGAADDWRFDTARKPAESRQRPSQPAMTAAQAEREIRSGVAALDAATQGRGSHIRRLSDLILVDASLPSMLLETLRSEELSDRTRADLYLALELAGSPESQAALVSVMADSGWSPLDSMRAIVALGGVQDPGPQALSELWALAHSPLVGGDRDDLPITAALALGSLGRNLREAEDSDYNSLRADLQDGAASAATPRQQSAFLQALGNTGDPDPALRVEISGYLDDASPRVRSAAAQTLGRLGTDQVAEELLQSFQQEGDGQVRGSIAGALAAWEDPSPEAMAMARTLVRQEPDEKIRYNMAVMLGRNLQAYPQNRVLLQELLSTEQSKRIRQQIAETLY